MKRWRSTSLWYAAGGALLGCALTLLAQLASREIPREIVAYRRDRPSAFGAIRLAEGRLTGFGYAPYPTYVNSKRAEEVLRPLIDPDSGRFLVQDHALGVASSASQFIAAVERDHKLSMEPLTSALLVGDPNPGTDLDVLPFLQGSAREIEDISEIYKGLDTRVLTRSAATPAHVLAALGSADIVHLSAHAEADLSDPGRSRFHLSPAGNAPGDLSVRDILRQRLQRTRLVVTAACDTQAGLVSASEGSLGLGSAFLTAGVPAVVSSLWKVDDYATARLFVHFHRELRRGADPLSALRTAQLQELGGSNRTWASFEVFGGVAERKP